ncbi:MAG: 30S ribosome-binding factor RbfA [Tissierellia bacterium]|jgi:ribosome-binding factor A|nr:30S ribosome-binding factor RbfA [Tissierellia bacterium]
MNKQRLRKINEEIRRVISASLLYGMKDPRLPSMINVLGAQTAADMKQVKIFVSWVGEEDRNEVLSVLNRASGYFRRELGKELTTYHTPEPRFYYDDSVEKGMEMDEILRGITYSDDETEES